MTDKLDYLRSLEGVTWWRSAWTRPPHNPQWDHDHCAACWAKFSDGIPDTLREGYTTGPDYKLGARYEWLCEECLLKLKDELRWSVGGIANDEPQSTDTPANSTTLRHLSVSAAMYLP
jgi:hypothetical protein